MSELLQKNDVLSIEKGWRIYAKIPDKFIVSNRRLSNKMGNHDFIVGEILNVSDSEKKREINALVRSIKEAFRHHGIDVTDSKVIELLKSFRFDMKIEEFDTSIFIGKYIVTQTEFMNDGLYGTQLKVTLKKMKNDKLDPNGFEIYFYQDVY